MFEKKFKTLGRLKTAYYQAGEGNEKKLLLVHGNVSSAEFYLPLIEKFEKKFEVLALDLRCFGDSDALPVDATRGYKDWTEDIKEFVDSFGWTKYYIAGWSLGGCICMQYIIDYAQDLAGVIFMNPGSPFGFGGTKGEEGTMIEPAGLGSGGGCANAQLVAELAEQKTDLAVATLHGVYFRPDYVIDPEYEKLCIQSMLKTKLGDGMYPGDTRFVEEWPKIAAGTKGICNTMSPQYGNVSAFADANPKPPILWVRGDSDIMVSDTSLCDLGFLGMSGQVPGWPGADVFPPQPMVSQTKYVLEKYKANGGAYKEVILHGGHGCHIESPDEFVQNVIDFAK